MDKELRLGYDLWKQYAPDRELTEEQIDRLEEAWVNIWWGFYHDKMGLDITKPLSREQYREYLSGSNRPRDLIGEHIYRSLVDLLLP